MNLWLEAIAAASFAFAGTLMGSLFSRLPKPYWLLGYFIPFSLIVIYGIAIHFPTLSFTPPISWMMMGQKKFAIAGFIIAMTLTTPLSRLPLKRDRMVILVLMAIMIFCMSLLPFIAPVFNRNQLAHLQTRIDGNGICRQRTAYTCGPAAAVTALHKLGLPGDEGQLAILSDTSLMTGTPPDILAEVLKQQYGKDGLIVEYRPFRNIAELKEAGLTLAVIKFGFMVDHYVTVLQVTDSEVIVGDPLDGLDKMSYDDFLKKWRFVGIVLKRK
jgi:Peptidase C39 family